MRAYYSAMIMKKVGVVNYLHLGGKLFQSWGIMAAVRFIQSRLKWILNNQQLFRSGGNTAVNDTLHTYGPDIIGNVVYLPASLPVVPGMQENV